MKTFSPRSSTGYRSEHVSSKPASVKETAILPRLAALQIKIQVFRQSRTVLRLKQVMSASWNLLCTSIWIPSIIYSLPKSKFVLSTLEMLARIILLGGAFLRKKIRPEKTVKRIASPVCVSELFVDHANRHPFRMLSISLPLCTINVAWNTLIYKFRFCTKADHWSSYCRYYQNVLGHFEELSSVSWTSP